MRDAGLHYCLFDPTGNITALVESSIDVPDQPAVAAGIMCRHPEVEQVGFLSLPAFPALPVLRMAGGEFCGNASMCAAALTALRRGMKPGTGSSLLLRVSGAQQPVAVCLQEEGEGCWAASVTMPPARSVEEQAFRFGDLQGTLPLVRMEGISHLLVEPDSPFSPLLADRAAAEQAVRRWCGELQTDGLGLMFLEGGGEERNMTPLVYVPGVGTTFWENSCASGSAAAGMYLAARHGVPAELTLHEPGGDLRVSSDPANGEIRLRGEHEKEQQVGSRLGENLDRFEHGEFDGLVLLPKLGKEDGRDAVAEQDGRHIDNQPPVAFIAQGGRYRPRKRHHAGQEGQIHNRFLPVQPGRLNRDRGSLQRGHRVGKEV